MDSTATQRQKTLNLKGEVGFVDLLLATRVVPEKIRMAGKGLQDLNSVRGMNSGDDVGDPSNPDYSDGSESHLNGKGFAVQLDKLLKHSGDCTSPDAKSSMRYIRAACS